MTAPTTTRRAVPAPDDRFVEGWQTDQELRLVDADGDRWTLVRYSDRWRVADVDGSGMFADTAAAAIGLAEAAGARFTPWRPAPSAG